VAGRFPLYIDADVYGPFVAALSGAGWDVVRAVKAHEEGTEDLIHFETAVSEGRVLVTNDRDQTEIAVRWILAARPFPGLVTWAKFNETRVRPGELLLRFEELAARDEPFSPYPIVYLRLT